MTPPVDVSYLADGVILLRHFEAFGRVKKALSVVKKRSGPHEDAGVARYGHFTALRLAPSAPEGVSLFPLLL